MRTLASRAAKPNRSTGVPRADAGGRSLTLAIRCAPSNLLGTVIDSLSDERQTRPV